MPRPVLLWLVVLVACGAPEKRQQPVPETTIVDMYTCTVSLTRKEAPTYTGNGSDPDPAKATEAAWTTACASLPTDSRGDCRDKTRFVSSETRDGAAVTVTLTSVPVKISARSPEPLAKKDDACAAARLQACERAGVPGDCVASGVYVEAVDEVEGKKTVLSPPQ